MSLIQPDKIPLYWYSGPARIKGVIDRGFSLAAGEVLIPGVLNAGAAEKTGGRKKAAALADAI